MRRYSYKRQHGSLLLQAIAPRTVRAVRAGPCARPRRYTLQTIARIAAPTDAAPTNDSTGAATGGRPYWMMTLRVRVPLAVRAVTTYVPAGWAARSMSRFCDAVWASSFS